MKIVRASKQYMYDESGAEYLDCISITSHGNECIFFNRNSVLLKKYFKRLFLHQ